MKLSEWINPYYLQDEVQAALRESAAARPGSRYVVLDNVLKTERIEAMSNYHHTLMFRDDLDRHGRNGELLPYDASMKPMDHRDIGAELLLSNEFSQFCAALVEVELIAPRSVVKLRRHKPWSHGFWIHTDAARYSVAVLGWYNRGWRCADGGLLQLWRAEENQHEDCFRAESPKGRLDFLQKHQRIRTATVGGGFPGGESRDFVLTDQVLPEWNRIIILNFQTSPIYHSVTPSSDRERFGFVLWVEETP